MADLNGYRERASKILVDAKQNENDQKWQEAFDNYMKALEIFKFLLKCKSCDMLLT